MKKCLIAAQGYSAERTPEAKTQVDQSLAAAYSKIDKAVKQGVLHKNNGARKKARLAKAVKKAALAEAS
jgi:small subunit ribosomal protein S20